MLTTKIITSAVAALLIGLTAACSTTPDENRPTTGTETATAVARRTTAEEYERLSQQLRTTAAGFEQNQAALSAQPTDHEMPAGYLPRGVVPGSTKSSAKVRIIDPDEFGKITELYRQNTLRLQDQLGEDRIIVSNWVDSIVGTERPYLVWSNGRQCRMETTPDNLAALKATPPDKEIVVSGRVDYHSPVFTMHECRVHGRYASGSFQHALAPDADGPHR